MDHFPWMTKHPASRCRNFGGHSTQHTTPSGPTTDTVRTYAAPEAGTHNLLKVTQTGTSAHEENYTYDDAGNTDTRQLGTAPGQDLLWDDEGHLATVTQGSAVSSYLYDADGQRMIRRDSTGTTLYLPQGNELHLDKNGTVTGTRYYSAEGQTVAVRTGGKLTFLLGDHHGTGTTQVTADAAQIVTRRKTHIFGAPRAVDSGPWVGDKGFVGGTKDADTGLTHLGAREYDPAVGRFISVDPIMDLNDPQQINGYTYANNNPVTSTDPTGLREANCVGGFSKCGSTVSGAYTDEADGSARVPSSNNGSGAGDSNGDSGTADVGSGTDGGGIFAGHSVFKQWLFGVGHGGAQVGEWGFKAGYPLCWFGLEDCEVTDHYDDWAKSHGGDPDNPAYQKGKSDMLTVIFSLLGEGWVRALGSIKGTAKIGEYYYTPNIPKLAEIVNPTGSKLNCRACAIATDKLFATGIKSSASPVGNGGLGMIEGHYGRSFQDANFRGIVREMWDAGHGARGIVAAKRNDVRIGHVFNVVNIDGRVIFVDGQSGLARNPSTWDSYKFIRTD